MRKSEFFAKSSLFNGQLQLCFRFEQIAQSADDLLRYFIRKKSFRFVFSIVFFHYFDIFVRFSRIITFHHCKQTEKREKDLVFFAYFSSLWLCAVVTFWLTSKETLLNLFSLQLFFFILQQFMINTMFFFARVCWSQRFTIIRRFYFFLSLFLLRLFIKLDHLCSCIR